jgi:predicted phosphatase
MNTSNLPPVAQKVICVDFDGTIFPWGEINASEPPFPHAVEVIKRMKQKGWTVIIFTSRMSPTWWNAEGWNLKEAMQEQLGIVQARLAAWDIPYDRITCEKVPAAAYIDDRAIHFDPSNGWAELEAKELAWM